ncbi:MAG TPA: type IV toxin-antitoxin system AbiEi family antitoxin domain-containing protein [Thermoleophilaceae bacterium]
MPDVVDPRADNQPFDQPRLARVSQIATKQGGPISREQLLDHGITDGAIRYWLASGRLHCYYRGVYLLGHEAITAKGRMLAPVLAYGHEAVLGYRSAGHWRGFYRTARPDIDVVVPGRTKAKQPGIDLHLVRSLDPRDVTEHEGIPITTVPRTLLDLAEVLNPRQLKRAAEEADRMRLVDWAEVQELLERSPGRHGLKPLGSLLADFDYEPLSRSEFEALFYDFCMDHGLPRPTMNAPILGYTVDAHWPGTNVIVELDSREFHLNAKAFEDDRKRDGDLLVAGYRVLRVTYRQLMREPKQLADRITKLLAYPPP